MTLLHAPEILAPIDDGSMTVAALAHDLGNLIQIASSAINIIARTPEMPAIHAAPMLNRARTCLEHAGALVRQNIGSVRDRSIVASSDVASCISEVMALIDAADEAGPVFEVDLESDLPAAACDPVGLRRAVLNLLFNARDAIVAGGHVIISARAIDRRTAKPWIDIGIADNGVGMPPATIARAFDPFFTTKADGLGGVGLPMVGQFVRDAGGRVSIASEAGVGTTVTVRLPARLFNLTREIDQ